MPDKHEKVEVHHRNLATPIVRRNSHQRHTSELDIAKQMDIERGNLSMDKYIKALKCNDPNIQRRNVLGNGI